MNDLAIALQPTLKKKVDRMAQLEYDTINFILQRYYDSYDPVFYRRQYDFLRSGFKVDARIVRGKAVASVYIDTDYMSNYYGVSGEQATTWANEGLHGGKNLGTNTPHVFEKSRIYSQSVGKEEQMILYKKDVIDKLSEKTGLYKKDIKAMLVALNELVYEERIYCVVVIKSMRQISAASCRR